MCRTPTLTVTGLPEGNGDTTTIQVPVDQRTSTKPAILCKVIHGFNTMTVPAPPGSLYKLTSRFWNSYGNGKNPQRPKQSRKRTKLQEHAPVPSRTYYKAAVIKTVVQTTGSTNVSMEWNREPRNRPIYLVGCFPTNTSKPPNGKEQSLPQMTLQRLDIHTKKRNHDPCLTPHTRNNSRRATDPNTAWSYQTSEKEPLCNLEIGKVF